MPKRKRTNNGYETNTSPTNNLAKKGVMFIRDFLKRAQAIKNTVNFNRVLAQNGLAFSAKLGKEINGERGSLQVILSLVNTSGKHQAWLAIQPKILKKNGEILTYFTLGRSRIQRKGYGEFLRAMANKIGRDVGAQGSNQWAVNINGMGGPEPPSAGIMRKLGAHPYKHHSPNRNSGVHFMLPKTESRANALLRNRFGLKIPNIPRTFNNHFRILASDPFLSQVAMSKNNAHDMLMKKIVDPTMMNAVNRVKRRITNNRISPYNLMMKYKTIFNNRAAEARSLKNRLTKRRKTAVGALSPINFNTSRAIRYRNLMN